MRISTLARIVAALFVVALLGFMAGCDQTGAFGSEQLTKAQIEARLTQAEAKARADAAKDAADAKLRIEAANRKAQSKVKRADLNTQEVAIQAADELASEIGSANATLDANNNERAAAQAGLNAMGSAAYAEIDRKSAALSSVFAVIKPFAAAVPGGSEGVGLLQSLLVGTAATGIGGTVLQTVRAGRAKKDLKSIINGIDKLRNAEPTVKTAMKAHKEKFEGQLTLGAKHAISEEAL